MGEEWRLGKVLPALIRGLLFVTFDPRHNQPRFLIEAVPLLARRAAKFAKKWSLKEATAIFSRPRRSSLVLG